MNVRYTRHARRRMRLYRVSEEDILFLLEDGKRRRARDGKQRADRTVEGIKKTIVFVEEQGEVVIITVWSDVHQRRKRR